MGETFDSLPGSVLHMVDSSVTREWEAKMNVLKHRRNRRLSVEVLEGRALLTTLAFEFSGPVSLLQGGGPNIPIGAEVTGYVAFESNTPDATPGGSLGTYEGAIVDASIEVADQAWFLTTPGTSLIQVGDNFPGVGDAIAFSFNYIGTDMPTSGFAVVGFSDTSQQALDSTALTMPGFAEFSVAYVEVTGFNEGGGRLVASLIEAEPVLLVDAVIVDMLEEIESIELRGGLENALTAKLDNVLGSWSADNADQRKDLVNKIEAFINSVEAQRDKAIDDADADSLTEQAWDLIETLTQAT